MTRVAGERAADGWAPPRSRLDPRIGPMNVRSHPPAELAVALHPQVRVLDRGRVLVGGTPPRVLRLTAEGARDRRLGHFADPCVGAVPPRVQVLPPHRGLIGSCEQRHSAGHGAGWRPRRSGSPDPVHAEHRGGSPPQRHRRRIRRVAAHRGGRRSRLAPVARRLARALRANRTRVARPPRRVAGVYRAACSPRDSGSRTQRGGHGRRRSASSRSCDRMSGASWSRRSPRGSHRTQSQAAAHRSAGRRRGQALDEAVACAGRWEGCSARAHDPTVAAVLGPAPGRRGSTHRRRALLLWLSSSVRLTQVERAGGRFARSSWGRCRAPGVIGCAS
jgi:hypothetical protein